VIRQKKEENKKIKQKIVYGSANVAILRDAKDKKSSFSN